MENGIEPKRTISLTWDDPWKKYEEVEEASSRGRQTFALFRHLPDRKAPEKQTEIQKNKVI